MPVGERWVWSTQPTALQRQMPDEAVRAIALFEQEAAAHRLALSEFEPPPSETEMRLAGVFQGPPAVKLSAAMVAIKNDELGLQFRFLTDPGIGFNGNGYGFHRIASPGTPFPMELPDAALELSAEASAMVRARRASPDDAAVSALREEMANLGKSDRVGCVLSDVLDQIVRETQADIVAAMPVWFGVWAAHMAGFEPSTLAGFWKNGESRAFEWRESQGILTLRAGGAAHGYMLAATRRLVARFAAAAQTGGLGLEELAIVCAAHEHAAVSGSAWVMGFWPQEDRATVMTPLRSYNLLRIYGLLSTKDRGAARDGGLVLRPAKLTGRLADAVNDWIFFDQPRLNAKEGSASMLSSLSEPTVLLGDGYLPDAQLTVNVTTSPMLVQYTYWAPENVSVEPFVARNIGRSERSTPTSSDEPPRFYAVAEFATLDITADFANGFGAQGSVAVSPILPAERRVPAEQLQDEFKKRIGDMQGGKSGG